mmetsp:Transcript_92273/g.192984  ORF Transcript_92273/g.192984 Transcript_92273/m.192984 type:complete len:236 (+) Transcript_92273:335-1042(+)
MPRLQHRCQVDVAHAHAVPGRGSVRHSARAISPPLRKSEVNGGLHLPTCCGHDKPHRHDRGTTVGDGRANARPRDVQMPLNFDPRNHALYRGGRRFGSVSPRPRSPRRLGRQWEKNRRFGGPGEHPGRHRLHFVRDPDGHGWWQSAYHQQGTGEAGSPEGSEGHGEPPPHQALNLVQRRPSISDLGAVLPGGGLPLPNCSDLLPHGASLQHQPRQVPHRHRAQDPAFGRVAARLL